MKVGSGSDAIWIDASASLCDDTVELNDIIEEPVCDGFVEERPQAFGRLELGAVGRQVDQPDAIGNVEVLRAVPAGVVEREHDDA